MLPRPGNPDGTRLADADLVTRCRAGDRAAWGQLYERYADRLFDYACRLTGNRAEASDCVQDAFVLAVERIGQLRDPDKLRPWLYAIVRSTAHRHYRRVNRWSFGDVPETADGGDDTMMQGITDQELASLIDEAAAGLTDDDREVLDLHLRHDLAPADIAAALGVSTRHAAVTSERMRERLGRSIGVTVLARNPHCDEFAALVRAEGPMTPLVRKRLARHIDGCAVCSEQQRRLVRPEALLGLLPLLLVPHKAFADFQPELERAIAAVRERQVAVDPVQARPADGGLDWDDDGFPVDPRRRRRPTWLPWAAALLVVLAGGAAGVAWTQRDGGPGVAAAPPIATDVSPEPTSITSPPATAAPVTTEASAVTDPTPAGPPPTGSIVGAPTTVASQGVIGGDKPIDTGAPTTAASEPPPPPTSPATTRPTATSRPATTTTRPPATTPVSTSPTTAGPGTTAAPATTAAPTTAAPTTTAPATTTTAPDTTGPSISAPKASPFDIATTYFGTATCNQADGITPMATSTTVSVTITDPSGVASVTWSWSSAGVSGGGSMARNGSTFTGSIGPIDSGSATFGGSGDHHIDSISVVIVAKDALGNTTQITAPSTGRLNGCTVIL